MVDETSVTTPQQKISESASTVENTERWAKITGSYVAPPPLKAVEVGEIPTEAHVMTNEEKNDMLHKVALEAAKKNVKEEPTQAQKEDLAHKELLQQATELADQAQDIETISYTAQDMKNFSQMTSDSAQKTFNSKDPNGGKPKEVAAVQIPTGPKTFFEEILAKQTV